MARMATLLLPMALLAAGQSQGVGTLASLLEPEPARWCHDGIAAPDFVDDGGTPSVEVIVGQAPLFSANPKIGQTLGWLGLFHTALVLAQSVNGTVYYWTLEFAAVNNVLGSTLPSVNEENRTLDWENAARYCATEGILWGRDHYTVQFEPVMKLTSAQAAQLFTGFVLPLNNTAASAKPLYQLWKVVSRSDPDTALIQDITCGDGASWVLHYATTVLGATLRPGFELRYTSIIAPAEAVEPANISDPEEWQRIFEYFRVMVKVVRQKECALMRLLDLFWLLPVRYVYNSNAGLYYRVIGSLFPWLEARNPVQPLHGPPWSLPAANASQPSLRPSAAQPASVIV